MSALEYHSLEGPLSFIWIERFPERRL